MFQNSNDESSGKQRKKVLCILNKRNDTIFAVNEIFDFYTPFYSKVLLNGVSMNQGGHFYCNCAYTTLYENQAFKMFFSLH